jgi:S-adenosylmethionine-diacylgycerolhomoserine-N-methlytransferase
MPSSAEPTPAGPSAGTASTDHSALMDSVYRGQRHVYDLTRRYYLLGRDALIERMELREGDRVLEIGCGTARNLIRVARRYPRIELFGFDASGEMLKTAQRNTTRAGVDGKIRLAHCLAEEFSRETSFGLTEPFDTAFFSYSLSMIPAWQAAVDRALINLKPHGSLWVVDFWDQSDLPRWFARLLKRWLGLFHVRHRPELIAYFQELEKSGVAALSIEPLYRRYAYLARLRKLV